MEQPCIRNIQIVYIIAINLQILKKNKNKIIYLRKNKKDSYYFSLIVKNFDSSNTPIT